jgi:N-dimethylarginine dimethylaminohydrolase
MGFLIAGEITGEGKVEGGDLIWIDRYTLLAGIGYRTNLEGVRQLGELAGEDVEILWFDMPHYKGRSDVFHLMSTLSPLDHDLAVAYPPLMAARQIEFLESRGIRFVEVPPEEFDSMGCNVLALGPRHAMMVEGNPETERRLRAAGVKVEVIKGYDICRKGEGGPTCMTRPLVRG